MRFLRWYGRLTKAVFVHNTDIGYFKDSWNRFVCSLKWYLVTILMGMLVIFLWLSLPGFAKDFIIEFILIVGGFLEVAIYKVWIFIKPFFDRSASFNWIGIAHRIDRAVHWLYSMMIHLIIGLLAFNISILILEGFSILIFRVKDTKKCGTRTVIFIGAATLFGYYITTSSYAVSITNWCTSWLIHVK